MPSASTGTDAELPDSETPSETVTAEAQTPFALWQYRPSGEGFEPTAPINIVFELADSDRTLSDVMDVLRSDDWYTTFEEYARYAYNALEDQYEHQHATAAQTYYGGFGRHHVRCWEFDGFVSMQAHQDTPANPHHGIESYERTRELLGARFAAEGWSVTPGGLRFDNEADPDHCGAVTVIRP
ncbi:hypothetical protein ACLI4Z_17225 [Natrialbaceae archaeon A-arb3/5]